MQEFAIRVQEGEYCDGWGWDDAIYEERDWGDESWSEEMDAFFLKARKLLMQGDSKHAEKIYRTLFETLDMGQEPGHLPGADHSSMLEVDVAEHVALLLRSIYLNADCKARPDMVYENMRKYRHWAFSINLKDIIDGLEIPLPDFERFLEDWIEFLKRQSGTHVSDLLREAVFIKGGIPAISEFARENPDKHPKAYIDWINALEQGNDTDSILKVAREGLSKIPRDHIVRAEVGEVISKIGETLNDNDLKLEGYKESFYSNPSVDYVIDLYITAINCDCFEEIRDEVEQRINELKGKEDQRKYGDTQYEYSSHLSKEVLINSMLLGGRYEKVFEMCEGEESLGWSSSYHPKPILSNFLMIVLSKKRTYTKVLNKEWEYAISNIDYSANKEYVQKYQRIIDVIKEDIQMTEKQEEFYLNWCKDEIGSRVDEIVSNQYRGSYFKAAGLIVAMAETLMNRGKRHKAMEFFQKYRDKYPRHRSFIRELSNAVQESGLFD